MPLNYALRSTVEIVLMKCERCCSLHEHLIGRSMLTPEAQLRSQAQDKKSGIPLGIPRLYALNSKPRANVQMLAEC